MAKKTQAPDNNPRVPFNCKTVLVDSGNKIVKTAGGAAFGSEFTFPQFSKEMDDDGYELNKTSYVDTFWKGSSIMFKVNGVPHVVGDEAMTTGSNYIGPAKYEEEAIRPLIAACLTKIFPNGKDDLSIWITYPFNAEKIQIEKLKKSLKGKYHIEYANGHKVSYTIEKVVAMPEAQASAATGMLTQDGRWRTFAKGFTIKEGRALIVDIGSTFSAIMPMEIVKNGNNGFRAINEGFKGTPVLAGINQVYSSLSSMIINNVPEFANMTKVSEDIMDKLLLHGILEHRGLNLLEKPKSVKTVVINGDEFSSRDSGAENSLHTKFFGGNRGIMKQVMSPFVNALEAAYQQYGYGASYSTIMISGGAGEILRPWVNQVLDHPNCGPVIDPERMIFSTVIGMSRLCVVAQGLGKA